MCVCTVISVHPLTGLSCQTLIIPPSIQPNIWQICTPMKGGGNAGGNPYSTH